MRYPTALRRVVAVLAAAGALTTATVVAPSGASAFSTTQGVRLNAVEARLVYLINKARTDRGLAALTVAPGMTDLARSWSLHQATKDLLYHNPGLGTGATAYGATYWTTVGENVGRGWTADPLFQAYMNSPGHRANILDPDYRYLGMGWVERPDGSGYNTQVFVDRYSSTYGRTRRPAVGGLADTRTPASTASVASFETGWDPRVMVVRSGTGLAAAGPYFATPAAGDQSVRFVAREALAGVGGGVELRMRDALDLRHTRAIRVRLSASTATGRSVSVQVGVRRELGSYVLLGRVTVPSGGRSVTATLALPSGARNFRNALTVSVTRTALQSLSGTLSGRSASVRVADIAVVV